MTDALKAAATVIAARRVPVGHVRHQAAQQNAGALLVAGRLVPGAAPAGRQLLWGALKARTSLVVLLGMLECGWGDACWEQLGCTVCGRGWWLACCCGDCAGPVMLLLHCFRGQELEAGCHA